MSMDGSGIFPIPQTLRSGRWKKILLIIFIRCQPRHRSNFELEGDIMLRPAKKQLSVGLNYTYSYVGNYIKREVGVVKNLYSGTFKRFATQFSSI